MNLKLRTGHMIPNMLEEVRDTIAGEVTDDTPKDVADVLRKALAHVNAALLSLEGLSQ